MDRKRLETLKRLREILFAMGLTQHHRLGLSYKQYRTHRKILDRLSVTLFETCILDYETRKQMKKEIRELLKEEI